jgi:ABC-type oligopeptide transport system substrate-binding subunit
LNGRSHPRAAAKQPDEGAHKALSAHKDDDVNRPGVKRALLGLVSAALLGVGMPSAAQDSAPKTLKYAFLIAESGFDPVQLTDLYSRTVVAGIFDAPLRFEYLARPYRMRPNTVVEMPEVSADFKTFTFKLRPASISPTTRPSRARSASWWRPTTSIR